MSRYAVSVTGERACPPEVCGGPWSYDEFLEATLGRDDLEHKQMLESTGDNSSSKSFPTQKVNRLPKMTP